MRILWIIMIFASCSKSQPDELIPEDKSSEYKQKIIGSNYYLYSSTSDKPYTWSGNSSPTTILQVKSLMCFPDTSRVLKFYTSSEGQAEFDCIFHNKYYTWRLFDYGRQIGILFPGGHFEMKYKIENVTPEALTLTFMTEPETNKIFTITDIWKKVP